MVSNVEFTPEQFNRLIEFVQKNFETVKGQTQALILAGAEMQARIKELEVQVAKKSKKA